MVEYKDVLRGVSKVEDSNSLLILDGTQKKVGDVFKSNTIIINNVNKRENRLDFSIQSKFKSKGYKTLHFCDNNVVVYTKNTYLIKNGVDVTIPEVKEVVAPVVDETTKEYNRIPKPSFGGNFIKKDGK